MYAAILAMVILAVALGVRITALRAPAQVVFDEVHFGKFVTAYCCTGERFFDIHPPHAKLLIAGVAHSLGFRGAFPFENISQPYGDTDPFPLRLVPAVAGSLVPLLLFLLLLSFGVSRPVAFLGGMVLALDNAFIVQSRVISLDMVLLAATIGALLFFQWAHRTRGIRRIAWLIAAGGAAGLALGSKFTGLTALVLVGLMSVVEAFAVLRIQGVRRAGRQLLVEAVVVGGAAAAVYLGGWAIHFLVLQQPGSGDMWGHPRWERPLAVSFIRETVALHRVMLNANYNLSASHPDESPWWSWPFMLRPVFYWQDQDRSMYFLGNPVVWWSLTILGVMTVIDSAYDVWRRRTMTKPLAYALAGYLIALLPLTRVPRALFLYHYLSPLVFCCVLVMIWLSRSEPIDELPLGWRQVGLILIFVVAGWLLIMPLTYGLPYSDFYQAVLLRLPRWTS
jgi:dolichyl-phosphate-mannose--protein O-mannosyl transferase